MNASRQLFLGAIAIATLVAAAPVSRAQPGSPPPPPPPGSPVYYQNPDAHRHVGFYFRTWLGLGYTRMTASDADAEISGSGGGVGFAVGGAVQENLILYAELFDDIAVSPDVEVGGMTGSADDTSAGVVAIGAGLAYYIVPHNIYVSGTVAASQLTIQQDGEEIGESEFGLGFSAMVGKEWWVSDNWGLGIAGQIFAGQMDDKNDGPTWSTTAFAVAFSATFN